MPRTTELKVISVSSIEDYQNDRLRWCYKWIENRVPRKVPTALKVGKLIHKAFEAHFKNPNIPVYEALERLLPAPRTFLEPREQEEVDQARGLIEPLQFWRDTYPVTETLEVEEPFEYFLTSGAKLRGRPDRVVVVYDKVFHMQHKTAGASARIETFVLLATQKMHELLYGRYLAKKYKGLRYGGSIYNIIRKLKYRSKTVTKAEPKGKILHTPSEMLFQQVIPIDPQSQEQAYEEANDLSVLMDRTMEMYLSDKLVPRNRQLDGGKYGNSIDPYTLVAIGEISLSDDTFFMDREETYEVEESNETES